MLIIGIIFCVIVAIIIILSVASKNPKAETSERKKEFAIPPQKRYPFIYVKDCKFYADAVSRFEYSEEEIEQFIKSLEESFSREDYLKTIKISNEVIKILPKTDKVWTKKISAIFLNVIKNEECWSEKLSRIIINCCFGFLQCYETVIEKSVAAKHILLPILLKNIDSLIKYQNNNVTKYHNLEVYNMLLNLYYVIPYREVLILLSNYLLEDKTDKDFGEVSYVKHTLKNLLSQVDMVRTKNTSRLQESFDTKKITNCTLITDERTNANIVAFELNFEAGVKKQTIEAAFYDEIGKEMCFGKKENDKFIEVFEVDSDRGLTAKEEIVLLTGDPIDKVVLRIYKGEETKQQAEDNVPLEEEKEIESKDIENKDSNKLEDTNAKNEEEKEEVEDFKSESDKINEQTLMYPAFNDIKAMGISDTQFVCLKNNGRVVALGTEDRLEQQITTWENIEKIYVKDDAVFGIREDGTVIYAGKCDYERAEYIYSWGNVESLSFGEKHLVALTKNNTTYSVGANSNGECDVEEWYDIIQLATAYHTVGLRKDGKVNATGENNFGECDVKSWQDIVQVAVGDFYTLGLTSSGKVLATGLNSCGQCNVSEWANIKRIYAKGNMSIGLRYDGKVVTAGKNTYHYGDIKNWVRIKDIVVSSNRIVGIEYDGTVRASGKPYKNFVNGNWTEVKNVVINNNNIVALKENGTLISNNAVFGYCLSDETNSISQICEDVEGNKIAMLSTKGVLTISDKLKNSTSEGGYPTFYDVKKIAMNGNHIVMLKNDGTVENLDLTSGVSESITEWDNIIDIQAGKGFIIGLDISGKVIAKGENAHGECEVSEWHDIVKICASGQRAIGLSIDGKLYMSGVSEFGEDDFIKLFKNVKDFALTDLQTMILEGDGTVKVTYHPIGVDTESVKAWKNIKKVVARGENFLCLSEEGKVYSTIENEVEIAEWEDIEDISASRNYVWATLKS